MTHSRIARTAWSEALTILLDDYETYDGVADALQITRQSLYEMRKDGVVTHTRLRRVAELTGVPEYRLRPDLVRDWTSESTASPAA